MDLLSFANKSHTSEPELCQEILAVSHFKRQTICSHEVRLASLMTTIR